MNLSETALLAAFPYRSSSPVLIDVGGHHGIFSAEFARRGWRVVAFEPEATNRAAFERNLGSLPKVTVLPLAVSNADGQRVPFYVSAEHFGIHALQPFHATHRPAYEVETTRLDTALRGLAITEVTLLKIDIEGADFLAIQGFDFAVWRPEAIMVEFMDERSSSLYGYTHHDMAAYMAERGYTTFVSEWAPIREYARAGETGEAHSWLRCAPYPLDHTPAWGNLIFVPGERVSEFQLALRRTLRHMRVKEGIKRIPGSRTLFRLLTRR